MCEILLAWRHKKEPVASQSDIRVSGEYDHGHKHGGHFGHGHGHITLHNALKVDSPLDPFLDFGLKKSYDVDVGLNPPPAAAAPTYEVVEPSQDDTKETPLVDGGAKVDRSGYDDDDDYSDEDGGSGASYDYGHNSEGIQGDELGVYGKIGAEIWPYLTGEKQK